MTRPRTSGHCATAGQTPDPIAAHGRCTLAGCACVCHTPPAPPPRVKVPLSCLQGRHTPTCGHQAPTDPPAGEHTPPVASPTGADPHTCEWELGPRADGTLVCACGATIRNGVAAYPDDLHPPGEQLAIAPPIVGIRIPSADADPYVWPLVTSARQAGKTAAAEAFTGLTDDEKRRVIAAHLELHPATILATIEAIIRERDACHRFHPAEPCRPGDNHPGAPE